MPCSDKYADSNHHYDGPQSGPPQLYDPNEETTPRKRGAT
jgi:hypothetical protein